MPCRDWGTMRSEATQQALRVRESGGSRPRGLDRELQVLEKHGQRLRDELKHDVTAEDVGKLRQIAHVESDYHDPELVHAYGQKLQFLSASVDTALGARGAAAILAGKDVERIVAAANDVLAPWKTLGDQVPSLHLPVLQPKDLERALRTLVVETGVHSLDDRQLEAVAKLCVLHRANSAIESRRFGAEDDVRNFGTWVRGDDALAIRLRLENVAIRRGDSLPRDEHDRYMALGGKRLAEGERVLPLLTSAQASIVSALREAATKVPQLGLADLEGYRFDARAAKLFGRTELPVIGCCGHGCGRRCMYQTSLQVASTAGRREDDALRERAADSELPYYEAVRALSEVLPAEALQPAKGPKAHAAVLENLERAFSDVPAATTRTS
jgi:hypothetical protein